MRIKGDFSAIAEEMKMKPLYNKREVSIEQGIVNTISDIFYNYEVYAEQLFGKKVLEAAAEFGLTLNELVDNLAYLINNRGQKYEGRKQVSARAFEAFCDLEMIKTEDTCPDCGWGELDWTPYGICGRGPEDTIDGYTGRCNYCGEEIIKTDIYV